MTPTRNLTPVVLLVQAAQGGTIAVRFPSRSAAEAWEERNPDVETIGLVSVCTQTEALAQA